MISVEMALPDYDTRIFPQVHTCTLISYKKDASEHIFHETKLKISQTCTKNIFWHLHIDFTKTKKQN